LFARLVLDSRGTHGVNSISDVSNLHRSVGLASLRVGDSEGGVMGRGLPRGTISLAVFLAVGFQAITPDPDDLASSMMLRLLSMETAERGGAPNDDGSAREMGSVAILARGLYGSRCTHRRIDPLIADRPVPSTFGIVA